MTLPCLGNRALKMVSIMDMEKYLSAAGADWDSGPEAGEWIGPLLDGFSDLLGHAVPAGYEQYAIIPIPRSKEDPEQQDIFALKALIEELRKFTGEQTVHTALWEGWGWLYAHGLDPRTAPGAAGYVAGGAAAGDSQGVPDWFAVTRVERPNVRPLQLPNRNYYLWSGPLDSALALGHHDNFPSLIWPDDRSWFVGIPIYSAEMALGADARIIEAILSSPSMRKLGARRAGRDEALPYVDDED
ncbi:hypothetical protein C5Y44_04125 [Corynebacterium sp. J010B-136]|nr:hypothetical protein C5Y44_04125 [Corynebacterium sp. J010B-136]